MLSNTWQNLLLLTPASVWSLPGILGVGYLISKLYCAFGPTPWRRRTMAREDIRLLALLFLIFWVSGRLGQKESFVHFGAESSTNPFSNFATRNHANVFANPLVVLLAVFEHSPLGEVVILTSIFYSLSRPKRSALFSP